MNGSDENTKNSQIKIGKYLNIYRPPPVSYVIHLCYPLMN